MVVRDRKSLKKYRKKKVKEIVASSGCIFKTAKESYLRKKKILRSGTFTRFKMLILRLVFILFQNLGK